jgi:hypothetical protein
MERRELMGVTDSQTIDYAAIISDLEAKKAALDATITAFRAAQAAGALGVSVGDSMPAMADEASALLRGMDVPVGAFLGKSIPEAAKLCLQIVKRKMTSKEISENLKKGGIESTAQNFPSIVHSILMRASKGGSGIVKLDRSYWGLAEWYPAGLRTSSTDRRNGAKAKSPKPRAPKKEKSKQRAGTEDRITKFLWQHPEGEFSPQEIAESLGMRIQTAHFLLGKLAYRKAAEKTNGGKFRAVAP